MLQKYMVSEKKLDSGRDRLYVKLTVRNQTLSRAIMQSGYLWLAFLDAQVSTIRLIGTRWAWTSNTSSRRAVYYSHNEWVRVKQAHCAALTRNVSHNDLRARSASAWRLNYTPRCYLTFFPNNSKCKVLLFWQFWCRPHVLGRLRIFYLHYDLLKMNRCRSKICFINENISTVV